ncbi:TPA: type 1 fimbrial protein [Citrobacter freundii]|nr:type 1 fimbrial protein [Citrobacter freundii]
MKKLFNIKLLATLLPAAALFPCLHVYAESAGTITVTGLVLDTTCSFDQADYPVTLTNINSSAFTDTGDKNLQDVPVAVTCGSNASEVKIKVSGTADGKDTTAFANTGKAAGVGLHLLDSEKKVMNPKGTSTGNIDLDESTHKGIYTFKAAYVKTNDTVTPGTFSSVVNLIFNYG